MGDLHRVRIAIVGGRAFGLSAGLQAAWRGAEVTLYDPAPLHAGASGVAAGMLAPAFEAALDPASAEHFPILRAARDAWPALHERLEPDAPPLDRSGAMRVALADERPEVLQEVSGRLTRLDARVERLEPAEARRLQPALSPRVAGGAFTPDDWRIEPAAMLEAMAAALARAGGALRRSRVAWKGGRFAADGEPLRADLVVIAAGIEARTLAAAASELAWLSPIKGQALRLAGPPGGGPVVRGASGYLSPQPGGPVAGATMEAGRDDRTLDPAVMAVQRAEAARLFPALEHAEGRSVAGVRAATPDGLPLVGRSSRPGVILAVGARRNGWLLAPLVGAAVAAAAAGEPPPPFAERFDPGRFGAQPGEQAAVRPEWLSS